jgi:integral membrane protein
MNPVSTLRTIGLVEAVSYVLLVGVAMPMKYFLDMPLAVRVLGGLHGFLFVLFCWALLLVITKAGWSIGRAALVFAASLVPLATFGIDEKMKQWALDYQNRPAE